MIALLRMSCFDNEGRLISGCVIDALRSGLRLCVCLLERKGIIRVTGMCSNIWFNN